MKIKAMATLAKKSHTIISIFVNLSATGEVVQWLSDGVACYPLRGMPILTKNQIFRLFDIPEKDIKQFSYKEIQVKGREAAIFIDFDESDESNKLCYSPLTIMYMGDNYIPFYYAAGAMLAINTHSLQPLTKADDSPVYVMRRKIAETGEWFGDMIAIKKGLLLEALIAPIQLHTDSGLGELLVRVGSLIQISQSIEILSSLCNLEEDQQELEDPEFNIITDESDGTPTDPDPEDAA